MKAQKYLGYSILPGLQKLILLPSGLGLQQACSKHHAHLQRHTLLAAPKSGLICGNRQTDAAAAGSSLELGAATAWHQSKHSVDLLWGWCVQEAHLAGVETPEPLSLQAPKDGQEM